MATLKQRLHRKNSSGTYDTIHLETGADCITGTLAITNGGTGATTAANARTNLGAAASSHTHTIAQVTNLQSEINSLKTSVSSGKAAIASAVTGKGVQTAADASFQTMANNINALPPGYKMVSINVTADSNGNFHLPAFGFRPTIWTAYQERAYTEGGIYAAWIYIFNVLDYGVYINANSIVRAASANIINITQSTAPNVYNNGSAPCNPNNYINGLAANIGPAYYYYRENSRYIGYAIGL